MKSNEKNQLIDIIIKNYQLLFTVIGIIIIILSIFIYSEEYARWQKILVDFLGQIGGILVSTVIVTIAYERWKEKKDASREKYYLMNSTILETGEELKKIDLYRYHPSGKIMPIMERDELGKTGYKFATLLFKNIDKLKGKTVFIYGTTLNFLTKTGDNKDAFKMAIKNGVNFKFALVDPQIYEWEVHDQKIIDSKKESQKSIRNVKNIIKEIISENYRSKEIGTIELRVTSSISQYSFSSFMFSNGRSVRVLEFNLKKEKEIVKFSQVFDELYKEEKDKYILSDGLFEQYYDCYKSGIIVLQYPFFNCDKTKEDRITVYVCGIRKYREDERTVKKVICMNGKFPKIEVGINYDYESNCLNHISFHVNEKAGRDTKDKPPVIDSSMLSDDDYKNAINNTILGVVKNEYALLTGNQIQLKESIPFNDNHSNQVFLVGNILMGKNKENINEYEFSEFNVDEFSEFSNLDKERFESFYKSI